MFFARSMTLAFVILKNQSSPPKRQIMKCAETEFAAYVDWILLLHSLFVMYEGDPLHILLEDVQRKKNQ